MASKLDLRALRSQAPSAVTTPPSSPRVSEVAPKVVREQDLPRVTADVIDEAVFNVLQSLEIPEEEKEVLRKLMANDSGTDFAGNLFATKTEPKGGGLFKRLQRQKMTVLPVLSPEETADLVKYAPEFDFEFLDHESHDHAMAAAMRKVDTEIIKNILPSGMMVKDVGADPIQLINEGSPHVHGCNPSADWKDPSRGTIRMMRARKIAIDKNRSDDVRDLASRYLEADTTFVCGQRAQDCRFQAKVSRSIHVYDVPIQDWPEIMQAAGSVMHVGVVLFPTTAYHKVAGNLPVARARYEIDVDKNVFRMGFQNSASWFYSHSWLDFMRYGVDQIIQTAHGRYSYKVIERRGDSLFFQILRVDSSVVPSKQCYRLPGVPMVRVEGFEYVRGKQELSVVGRSPLRPKVHWFPQNLWMDMLQQAKMDFERGVFTFDKMYNYYRVVSPRNTINGVLLSGGERVHEDQMVALITHVGMCAASEILLAQRTSRAITDRALADRMRDQEALLIRMLGGFWRGLKTMMEKGPFRPMVWLCDKITAHINSTLAGALASWSVEPQLCDVEFSDLVGTSYMRDNVNWSVDGDELEEVYREHMIRFQHKDHVRALRSLPALAAAVGHIVDDSMSQEQFAKQVSQETETTASTTVVDSFVASDETVAMRRMAIRECIDESELEQKKIREICSTITRACRDASGEPNVKLLTSRAEEYGQPDFWYVNNGVLVRSALGLDALECKHSALYTPLVDEVTGSNFRTVVDDRYEDLDGVRPTRDYRRFASGSYTGWALSTDRLLIYNGPEIRTTLERAIDMDHSYKIELHQGPPGCGKTYELINSIQFQDVAMCPVRESALDTKKRLSEKYPGFPEIDLRVRTVDSYLTNYAVPATRALRCVVLHADEGFMTHAGKWYATAALLGCTKIIVYGDQFQIPHIPRVQARKMYVKIIPDVTVTNYVVRRCPADALAAWAHIYDYRIRTVSTLGRSLFVVPDYRQVNLRQGHVLLTMYQADKKEVRKMFSSQLKQKSLRVMTVHEAEGKTFDHVMLFRFDARPRDDKLSLFDQSPHVLVAMSRHRVTFTYIRPKDLGDLVDSWYKNSLDPRAVAAMKDMSTSGKSVRYL